MMECGHIELDLAIINKEIKCRVCYALEKYGFYENHG